MPVLGGLQPRVEIVLRPKVEWATGLHRLGRKEVIGEVKCSRVRWGYPITPFD
jgi:hypothetical protein